MKRGVRLGGLEFYRFYRSVGSTLSISVGAGQGVRVMYQFSYRLSKGVSKSCYV